MNEKPQCLFKDEAAAMLEKFHKLQEVCDRIDDAELNAAFDDATEGVFALMAALLATSEMHASVLKAQGVSFPSGV